ncbi:hypothetical protein B0H16DRAFT_25079 [Mycena metata]|uniref:T6SS Phospholipase effector Tle1-like catalytic domain-containing protein n=1 Tax=Mycena metata TaxID=1033252 RepID=A0AAD7P3J8_9AGAR|nr:hypothetical protein B0H16DRAFT_25079 [Mycena metata]
MSTQPHYSASTQYSDAPLPVNRVKKRIIVCCDGTWQDGVSTENRQSYTNILRLARTINHEDSRSHPPIPQIVFYQSGIGSEKSFYSEYIVGTTGSTLADKVEEAYGFIAHNYFPGDEIFLFGFSRGAYTARMTALFIGKIGVLDRADMDHFAGIFMAYQRLGKSKDEADIQRLNAELAPWTHHDSPGKRRADSDDHTFSIKFVGVFETVGSLGLPEELTHRSPHVRNLFGFNDTLLGEHIQRAYQALALNEPRADFNCCKFEQSPGGLRKGQVLRQCWFTGCHADVGGGYKAHDLADLTLFWMASNLEDHLSLDYTYLESLPKPNFPWGAQPPHDPATGIYALAHKIQRTLPTATNNVTHETIHCSVLQQRSHAESLSIDLSQHPQLVAPLLPLEDALRRHWPTLTSGDHDPSLPLSATMDHVTEKDSGLTTEAGSRVRQKNWLGKLAREIKSSIHDKLDL